MRTITHELGRERENHYSRAGHGSPGESGPEGPEEEGQGVGPEDGQVDERQAQTQHHHQPQAVGQHVQPQPSERRLHVRHSGDGSGDQAGRSDGREPVHR